MSNRRADHVGFRNGYLFCYHCGRSYHIQMPQPINMYGALCKQFQKDHKDCEKKWQIPVVDQSLPENQKALWWMTGMNGERGMSSEAIWNNLYYDNPSKLITHPSDPDDFRRCYLLLETVPEWKAKMDRMKPVSPVWSNLVDNWAKLTEMLLEQMAGKKNKMYQFMKELGC